MLDEPKHDLASVALAFDAWCEEHIKPWFADHVYIDADLQRRWAGGDVDLSRRLPSDLIVAAAEADPELNRTIVPYFMMRALPSSLGAIEPRVRDLYAQRLAPGRTGGPQPRRFGRARCPNRRRATSRGRAERRVVA